MKKLLILCAISICAFQVSTAQDVDEILNNYFESVGGLEKLKEMTSRKMEANMTMGGMEFTVTIIEKTPNLQRVDIDIQGMELIQAYDGKVAWTINPFSSGTEPQKMPDSEAEEMINQTFEDPFIDYEAKGHTVVFEGMEEVEGAQAYKLKLTKKNGYVEYHFFDAEYYVPIMSRTTPKSGPTAGVPAETFMSDYQEVDGIMFPHFLDTKINGQSTQSITITSVELNVDVEDDFFLFPEGAETDISMEKEMKLKELSKDAPKGDIPDIGKAKRTKERPKKKN